MCSGLSLRRSSKTLRTRTSALLGLIDFNKCPYRSLRVCVIGNWLGNNLGEQQQQPNSCGTIPCNKCAPFLAKLRIQHGLYNRTLHNFLGYEWEVGYIDLQYFRQKHSYSENIKRLIFLIRCRYFIMRNIYCIDFILA